MRRRLRVCRRSLEPSVRASHSRAIARSLVEHPSFQKAATLALYLAVDNEVDTGPLVEHAAAAGKRIYLPVVEGMSSPLTFVPFRVGDRLVRTRLGLWEPESRSGSLRADEVVRLDLVCLPLVGFDRHGGRLGYGGGFYDRTLAVGRVVSESSGGAARMPLLAGLAYAFQEVPDLPHEAHDVLLDLVVTENETFSPDGEESQSSLAGE
ncbi:MAG: 5-formyltetrahydrofolate cyclo-ligase [Magnetococcales bacterium]|nr:5-formyltetrahydrofolate cyclo-ligase [Magnetococcales bacterium]